MPNAGLALAAVVGLLSAAGAEAKRPSIVILFFSDNGCSGELGHFGMNWGKYTAANYTAYSNTPFRMYKKFVHEGGIASPFIAHWPPRPRKE